MLEAARVAYGAGICVVPPRDDGSKRPLEEWADYQIERPSQEQMRAWYGRSSGLGFVCGAISGNLELFEFDERATYDVFKEAAVTLGLGDLVERIETGYLEHTPGGGVHWFTRCDEIQGNKTLAQRPKRPEEMTKPSDSKVKTLIQTRGEGGYAVVAPSNGRVHPSRRAYVLVAGGPETIAVITAEERAELWRLAKAFDQMPRQTFTVKEPTSTDWEVRPGDAFAGATDWAQILEPHGWERVFTAGDETYWRRPGKDRGWSATTNYQGSDLLYVFTTNSEFEAERGYGKFAALGVLAYDRDYTKAAAALADKGFGTKKAATHIDPATGAVVEDAHLTDLGNAGRLVARHGPDLRWWSKSKRWLVWTGHVWDQSGETDVQERAKETALSIYDESIAAPSNERAEALRKWARTSESARTIGAMVQLARSDRALTVDADKLDGDPWLFNVQNGTLELRTGLFREHRREDLITKVSPVVYDPAATCTRWLAYLDRIFAKDVELIGFVQRAAGYALTGVTGERVMFILFGSGHNGKTVFIEVMTFICGEYATVSPVETLIAKKGDRGIPNDVARLKSARFVAASETEQGDKLAEAFIKKITGGDKVSARFLNAEWFDFTPQLKLFLATNHRPQISGTDPAIWDRIRLIPFEVEIPESERDKGLTGWLTTNEAAGILNWALEGCRRWQKEGLAAPDRIRRATDSYRVEEDVLGIFIEDCCDVQPLVSCSHADLYKAFEEWVKAHGEEKMSSKAFSQRLVERRGIRRTRVSAVRGWSGLRLIGQPAGQQRGRQEDGLE